MKPYYVYLVLCADSTFYTGISTDVERRVKEHNGTTKGAKYTRYRQPVSLAYQETWPNRSEAQKRENKLRSLSKKQKQDLAGTASFG